MQTKCPKHGMDKCSECAIDTLTHAFAEAIRERDAATALTNQLLVDKQALVSQVQEVMAWVRGVAANYDCDSNGHQYNTYCRVCEAEALSKKYPDRRDNW